jgi:hypothetical protein
MMCGVRSQWPRLWTIVAWTAGVPTLAEAGVQGVHGRDYWHRHYFLCRPHFFAGGAPEGTPQRGGGGNMAPD